MMLARLSRAFFYRHPGQLAFALVGFAAGIAVVTGVALLRGSLVEALDAVSDELVGERSFVVRHPSGRIPVETYAALARTPGAPDLVPVLRAPVRVGETRLELIGIDPFTSLGPVARGDSRDQARDRPGGWTAVFDPQAGQAPVAVSRATLELLDARLGDQVTLEHNGDRTEVRVASVVAGAAGLDRRLIADIARAQDLLGVRGWVSELLAPPEAGTWLRQHVAAPLVVEDASSRRASALRLTAGMRANLTAMSLLALATGLFVVYSVLAFLMVQRRRTFGMLRALGMTHRALARMLVVETFMIAAVGGLAGLVGGTLLADRLLALVAAPVAEVYGRLAPAATVPGPGLYIAIWLAGLAAALLVTVPVLREALAIPPGRLVRAFGHAPMPARLLTALAIPPVAAGLAWVVLDARLIAALGGLFLALAGLIVLIPAAGFGLLRWVGRRMAGGAGGGLPGRALRLLESARGRLSPALAALSLSLALALGMAMMILSFREAVGDWVDRLLRADVYVSVPGRTLGRTLAADEKRRLADLEGVAMLSSVRRARLVDDTRLTAYDLPRRAWDGFELLAGDPDAAWQAFDSGTGVLVSEPLARRRGLDVGDRIELPLPVGERTLAIAGVFRDYSSETGYVAVADRRYRDWFDDTAVDSVGLYLAPGAMLAAVEERVRALFGEENVETVTPADVRRQSLAVFDRTFRISWALAALVGLIALIALASALLAQGLERAREHATLRALGLEPGRLFALVTLQSGALAATAVAMALPLAVLIHYALTLLVQPRAFGWSLEAGLPPLAPVLWVVPAALAAGTLTGVYPAWRIVRRPVIAHLRAGR